MSDSYCCPPRSTDTEFPNLSSVVWQEEDRVVWCPTTGYSVVEMTHRFNVKLEADLVRLGKIHD